MVHSWFRVISDNCIFNCSLRCQRMLYLVLLKLRTSLTTFKGRIIDNSNPKNLFGGPHGSRLSHTINSCFAHQWKSIWMVNEPHKRSQSQKTASWKITVHSVLGRPSTGSSRPGTLGNQDVDSQADPLFSVPSRPLGLVGRPRTLGFTDKHLASNGLVTELSCVSGRPPGLGGRPHTLGF